MNDLGTLLQDMVGAGFLLLALAVISDWVRHRGRVRLAQAVAVSLLAAVEALTAVMGRNPPPGTMTLMLIAFAGSGYSLLLFRAALIPFDAVAQAVVGVLFALLAVALVAVGLPASFDLGTARAPQIAISLALVVLWAFCVGEPATRFLALAGSLPTLQRARLRALGWGYIAIAGVVVAEAFPIGLRNGGAAQTALTLLMLVMLLLLWAGFRPPTLLRRVWRDQDEAQFRHAIEALVLFHDDRAELARDALAWAMRLVGGDAACLIGDGGEVITAMGDMGGHEVAVATPAAGAPEPAILTIDHETTLVSVPVDTGGVPGRLIVLCGPVTPIFGSDDAARLGAYAAALSLAFGRVRLSENLAAVERAKSTFLNLASHELRGPLTVLRGYLAMIEAGDFGSFPALEGVVLPAMHLQTKQMVTLVEQMIETARLDDERLELHPEPCDLAAIVTSVLDERRSTMPATISVCGDVPVTPVTVVADLDRLRTIITNLVDNAVKYSPGGGELRCDVARHNGSAEVAVSDRGLGIDAESRSRLFTRFGRIVTPETAHIPGTGLGLYVCRELARRHGGDLTMHPRDGGGSVFTLTLPASHAEESATDGAEQSAATR